MYFASRVQAGRMLAAKLIDRYRYENCAVIALNDGGVVVGAQIATQLHCVLTLLLSAEIKLPHEPVAVAGMTAQGTITYNNSIGQGALDDLLIENRGYVEQEKMRNMHELNRLMGSGGTINRELLSDHNIIVVSDGLPSGFEIDLVYEFLKPIRIERLIFAIPFASIQAVDRMHVLADELCCLNVLADYQDTNHYYDTNDVPDHETVIKTIEQIILNWR
jgi:putative phosphoribosyl transferase